MGRAASCVAVLVWGLAGMGLIPLPGRARRLSLESWVRRLRVRYRRRSRQLVVAAVVWWPRRLPYRAVLRVTGGECEAGDGAGRPAGQPPRVERARQLVPRKGPAHSWERQRLRERIDLDAFAACRSLTVVVTTEPPPAREGTARVQLQRGPQARPRGKVISQYAKPCVAIEGEGGSAQPGEQIRRSRGSHSSKAFNAKSGAVFRWITAEEAEDLLQRGVVDIFSCGSEP